MPSLNNTKALRLRKQLVGGAAAPTQELAMNFELIKFYQQRVEEIRAQKELPEQNDGQEQ